MFNNIIVRKYEERDIPAMAKIWNSVVEDGMAFPQENTLSDGEAAEFFASQTHCGVAADKTTGEIYGMYILHPNNVGRCSHISNASYAVAKNSRGLHIGEKLVCDCLAEAKQHGFKIMQFNAVVASNIHAQHLYERLGFEKLGVIPGGFKNGDGVYEDIFPYVKVL